MASALRAAELGELTAAELRKRLAFWEPHLCDDDVVQTARECKLFALRRVKTKAKGKRPVRLARVEVHAEDCPGTTCYCAQLVAQHLGGCRVEVCRRTPTPPPSDGEGARWWDWETGRPEEWPTVQ